VIYNEEDFLIGLVIKPTVSPLGRSTLLQELHFTKKIAGVTAMEAQISASSDNKKERILHFKQENKENDYKNDSKFHSYGLPNNLYKMSNKGDKLIIKTECTLNDLEIFNDNLNYTKMLKIRCVSESKQMLEKEITLPSQLLFFNFLEALDVDSYMFREEMN
jgi:hypothetical protein